MRIAVNMRMLLPGYLEGYGYFAAETFRRITHDHPEHEFIFIFDRPYDERFIFSPNITPVVAGPQARHPLLYLLWFNISIPRVLKKYKADVFVSTDGFCSLNTGIPQCLVVHDLAFLHYPHFIKRSERLFYMHFTPRFLKRAQSVATVSEFSKSDIVRQYGIPTEKISVVYSAAKNIFSPVDEITAQKTRDRFTEGLPYFIYVGSIHPRKNLIMLLKAFSVFKKRQQSSMKLVLAGRMAWKNREFQQLFRTYKYRSDVVMLNYVDEKELAALIASAYALVYPSLFEGFGVPVLEAMISGVPAITSTASAMQETAGDAALYADPTDHRSIADQMMLIYKDENLRDELVKKGRAAAREYSWQKTSELLWNSILKAV